MKLLQARTRIEVNFQVIIILPRCYGCWARFNIVLLSYRRWKVFSGLLIKSPLYESTSRTLMLFYERFLTWTITDCCRSDVAAITSLPNTNSCSCFSCSETPDDDNLILLLTPREYFSLDSLWEYWSCSVVQLMVIQGRQMMFETIPNLPDFFLLFSLLDWWGSIDMTDSHWTMDG
jgi:hypothetical protein